MIIKPKMNTLEIFNALYNNGYTRRTFLGVFPRNRVPTDKITFPCSIVCNTDNDRQPGTHWIAINFDDNGNAEYFDSYGLSPMHQEFYDILSLAPEWSYTATQLQSHYTATCGQYCIFYLSQRAMNIPAEQILSFFGKNLMDNDVWVKNYVEKFYETNKPAHTDRGRCQICKSFTARAPE